MQHACCWNLDIKFLHQVLTIVLNSREKMTKKNILKILKSVKQDVRHQYKAELKGIFGSYSREEQSEESDVDILVRCLPGATLIDLSGLGNFLEQKLQSKVDIVSDRALRKGIESYVNNDRVVI